MGSHYAFEFLRENTIAKVVNGYMRNLFLFNMITLDGFFEGPERDINWHTVDDEFDEFAVAQLNSVDTLLFGRVTYELMASYWPTPSAIEDDPLVAGRMNEVKKIVVSHTSASDIVISSAHSASIAAMFKAKRIRSSSPAGTGSRSVSYTHLTLPTSDLV